MPPRTKFSREEPKLFQLLFMQERVSIPLFDRSDVEGQHQVPIAQWGKELHLSPEQAHQLFYNLWIFCYGICAMLARRVCTLTEEEIAQRIGALFAGQMMLLRSGQEEFTRVMPLKGANQKIMGYQVDQPPYGGTTARPEQEKTPC